MATTRALGFSSSDCQGLWALHQPPSQHARAWHSPALRIPWSIQVPASAHQRVPAAYSKNA